MGVTAIKGFHNETPGSVIVRNEERDGEERTIEASGDLDWDIWIPWCTSRNDFDNGKYITIDVQKTNDPERPRIKYWIWQHDNGTNDRIRWSVDEGDWDRYADPVYGDSYVNGDRHVQIYANGSVEFNEIAS
jgi:hypothetical protein